MADLAERPKIFPLKVTTKPMPLVRSNPSRRCFRVVNKGTEVVYILSGPDQKAADGIPVAADAEYRNQWCTGPYWIVAAAGTQDVRVEEDA